jgi:hypothetical protein
VQPAAPSPEPRGGAGVRTRWGVFDEDFLAAADGLTMRRAIVAAAVAVRS